MCRLSAIWKLFFLDILTLEYGTDLLPQTSELNYHLITRTIPEESTSQNMFNFSVSFHQKNAKWSDIIVLCNIISENIVQQCKVT